ncbi:MAG: hypothetical protein RIT07_1559 [Bacteroidota bacterium]|jgi:hypothetical protein
MPGFFYAVPMRLGVWLALAVWLVYSPTTFPVILPQHSRSSITNLL